MPALIIYLCYTFPSINKIGAVLLCYIAGITLGNIGILPEQAKSLQDLSLDEFMSFSEKFSDDIFKKIDFKNIVESRKSYGSASLKNVKLQIKNAKKFLNL